MYEFRQPYELRSVRPREEPASIERVSKNCPLFLDAAANPFRLARVRTRYVGTLITGALKLSPTCSFPATCMKTLLH